MNTAPIVSKVWSFCTTLRDDGVSYGDYLEQLTYLIFLKMADEYAKPPYNRDVGIPTKYNEYANGKFYDKIGFEPDIAVPSGTNAFDVAMAWIISQVANARVVKPSE